MIDIQGAVGLVQVKKLLRLIDERDKWANYYIKKLSGIPWLNLPKINSKIKHGWQSFVLMVDEKVSNDEESDNGTLNGKGNIYKTRDSCHSYVGLL